METTLQTQKTNGLANGHSLLNGKSRPVTADSISNVYHSIFDPNKYMLKLPKTKKVKMSNGQIRWEQTEADYLPVAARIAWFRREHPDWSIITKMIESANKAIVMKAVIKDASWKDYRNGKKKRN